MDFINQTDNYTCRLVTLLNAHIYKFGKSPLVYGNEEYFNFYNKVNGVGEFLSEEAYDLINATREEFNGTKRSFRKWFHNHILLGNLIDFSSYCLGYHSFLVCEYDKRSDSYMCVNSHIFTEKVAVEWMPYPIIIKGNNGRNSIKSFKNISVNNLNITSSAIIFKNYE